MASEKRFKILVAKDGGYYWHLQAANNRIVAWSGQTYTNKQDCVDDAYWVKRNSGDAGVWDHTDE